LDVTHLEILTKRIKHLLLNNALDRIKMKGQKISNGQRPKHNQQEKYQEGPPPG
jgi:hypothetical protein